MPSANLRSAPVVRGRPFVRGNPGRPAGSRNRLTRITSTLLEGDAEALYHKARDLALAGNVHLLTFLLGRILPRERPVDIDLPEIDSAEDAADAITAIMRQVAQGSLTPNEGAALAVIVRTNRQAIDVADLMKRIDAIEGGEVQ